MSGLRIAVAVFAKESLDALRDRRALMVAAATMLAGPLLVAFVLAAVGREDEGGRAARIALTGAEHAPDLARFLAQREITVDAASPVRLTVEADHAARLAAGEPARVTVELDSGQRGARAATARVEEALAAYSRDVAAVRLLARGIDPVVTAPLEVRVFDDAELSPRAAAGLGMLPVFLVTATLLGCTSLAIDATAGERERKSLEPLLLHPAGAGAVAVGKWLACFAFAAAAVGGMLLVLRAIFALPALGRITVPVDVGAPALLRLAALLVPFAALGAAAQLLMALRSRSFKEAQGQLSLLLFAPMLPGFVFATAPPADPATWQWVPLAGHQLLAVRVLAGAAVPAAPLIALGGVCLAAAAVLVALFARRLAGEEVLAEG